MSAPCTCYNKHCCEIRRARGLKGFCDPALERPAPKVIPENEFGTYAAAAEYAKAHGGKVRLVSGGTGTGSAKRFAAVR